jgi:coenzyme PQQ synthesis protein D (PqqD)
MSQAISNGSIVAAVKHQVSCDLAGEVVILNLQDGVYYGLNAVGARIWKLIEEPRSVDEIRAVLLEEYDIAADACGRQLAAVLNDLAAHGLVDVGT